MPTLKQPIEVGIIAGGRINSGRLYSNEEVRVLLPFSEGARVKYTAFLWGRPHLGFECLKYDKFYTINTVNCLLWMFHLKAKYPGFPPISAGEINKKLEAKKAIGENPFPSLVIELAKTYGAKFISPSEMLSAASAIQDERKAKRRGASHRTTFHPSTIFFYSHDKR